MNPESPITNESADRDLFPSPDFEPMYALTEAEYQAVINCLSGLLIGAIEQLRDDGQNSQATTLALQAHDILLGYDDDVAEAVRFASRMQSDSAGMGQSREKLW